jgi:hypothetical protein
MELLISLSNDIDGKEYNTVKANQNQEKSKIQTILQKIENNKNNNNTNENEDEDDEQTIDNNNNNNNENYNIIKNKFCLICNKKINNIKTIAYECKICYEITSKLFYFLCHYKNGCSLGSCKNCFNKIIDTQKCPACRKNIIFDEDEINNENTINTN